MWISIQHKEPECCISQNNQLFNLPQSWVFMSRFGSDLSLIRGGLTLLVSNSVWCGINFFEINTEEKQSRWQSNQLVFQCIICDEVWTQEMCTNSQLYICKHDCTVLICTLHYTTSNAVHWTIIMDIIYTGCWQLVFITHNYDSGSDMPLSFDRYNRVLVNYFCYYTLYCLSSH